MIMFCNFRTSQNVPIWRNNDLHNATTFGDGHASTRIVAVLRRWFELGNTLRTSIPLGRE